MTFTETSVSKNAKRVLTSPLTKASIKTAAQLWSAGPEGISLSRNELTNIKAQTPVSAFDTMGGEYGYCTVVLESKTDLTVFDKLASLIGFLTSSHQACEIHTGDADEPEAAEDDLKETLRAAFSCKLGNDTFRHIFNRNYTLLSGYEDEGTRTAVETWADNQGVLA